MKNCPNCHFENPDDAGFCTNCGAPMNGQPAYQPPKAPKVNPYDHTADFDEKDIADNKLFALGCYLLSAGGILLALLANKKSPYLMYHVRQAMKFILLNVALSLVMGLLVWTVLVPIAGGLLITVLLVVRLIAVVDVCKGKAVDPWLIRKIKFLN